MSKGYKGYKVIVKEYSGEVSGDDRIYLDEQAARYVYDLWQEKATAFARSEEAPEVKFEKVEYQIVNLNEGKIGRVLHQLDYRKRQDLVQQTAFQKLNIEEQCALGLSINTKGIKLHGKPLPLP